jgi:putative transposase
MTVQQAFRYELAPTRRQANALARAAGTARYAFNWGLTLARGLLGKDLGVPSAPELHRAWNAYKRESAPWAYAVSKCCGQEALRDLRRAFENFFASRQGKRAGPKVGFPRYRKKGLDDRFRLTGSIRVGRHGVKLPRIGWVRTKEPTTKFRGRALSATVRREADRWYVSLAVEVERPELQPHAGGVVGVDLGLKAFAVLSDGMVDPQKWTGEVAKEKVQCGHEEEVLGGVQGASCLGVAEGRKGDGRARVPVRGARDHAPPMEEGRPGGVA